MRTEQLSDAMEYLDEELIREAEEARSRVVRRRPAWQRWGALAACLAVAVFAVSRFEPPYRDMPGQMPGEPPYQFMPGEKPSSDVPPPDSDGPSQPLPLITIQDMGVGAMGYEGYLAYDISELGSGANPWTQEETVESLPVYKNPLSYDEMYRVSGADQDKMKALLLDVAGKLGLDTQTTPVTDNAPTEDYKKAITEKFAAVGEKVPEGYFDPTTLIMEADGIKIEVDQTLTARIDFDPPVELPDEITFTYSASKEEMAEAASWLSKEYSGLLSDMAEPVLDQGMADRNICGERSFDVEYFDGGGSLKQQIINYNFNRVAFYNDDEGKLFLARVYAPDLSQVMGNYPIITVEEAKELLLAGNYASSVPYDLPKAEEIAGVELVYRTGSHEAVWLPYYRFLVDLPEEYRPADKTLRDYGAYYVPAVDGRYITNMPTYDGSFNGGGTAVKKPDAPPEEEEGTESAHIGEDPGEPTPPMEESQDRSMEGVVVPGQK